MFYRQCALKKENVSQVSYIPERYANVGDVIKLKENGEWVDGWEVISVGNRVDEKNLPDMHKAIRNHRKNTGDSLPK